jgi:hypothetical protein
MDFSIIQNAGELMDVEQIKHLSKHLNVLHMLCVQKKA